MVDFFRFAPLKIELAEDGDRSLKVLAFDGRDSVRGLLLRPASSDFARVLVELGLLIPLEVDVVSGAWELLLDDAKLAEDETDFVLDR